MGDSTSADSGATSLHLRPAGYEVVRECLTLQQQAVPRSKLGRVFGARPLHPDATSWFGGAIGEIRVGELLSRLGPDWTVLHAVPVGTRGSDIDHVVVGPPGVFTINTKRHPGAKVWLVDRMLMVAGQKTDYLRNSRHEAQRAAKLLTAAVGAPVEVTPLLVLVEVASMTVKQRPTDVAVLTDSGLLRWLLRRTPTLSPEQLDRVAAAASHVRTWHKTADASVDESHMPEFALLRAEDRQARTRRRVWSLMAIVVAGVVGIQVLPAAVSALLAALSG